MLSVVLEHLLAFYMKSAPKAAGGTAAFGVKLY